MSKPHDQTAASQHGVADDAAASEQTSTPAVTSKGADPAKPTNAGGSRQLKSADPNKPTSSAGVRQPKPTTGSGMSGGREAREGNPAHVATSAEHSPATPSDDVARDTRSGQGHIRTPNPTYFDAIQYTQEFFQHQADVAYVMGKAAETGFAKFKTRTSEEYNRTGATASELFSLALSIAPGGAAILGVLQAMKSAEKIKKLAQAVEKISGKVESIHAINEIREKVEAIGEAKEERSEGQERGDFQMEIDDTLLEMAVASVKSRWAKQRDIDAILAQLEYADPSIDVKQAVVQALGPLPNDGELDASAKRTADEFEYLLYYQYFAESGRAVNVIYIDDELLADHTPAPRIEKVPDRVMTRIKELGKWGDFSRGVAAFNSVVNRTNDPITKPY